MKVFHLFVSMLLILVAPKAYRQKAPTSFPKRLIETTVCKILNDPSIYNNKLVKVRGYVEISFEYSTLLDQNCSDRGIWFALADYSAPPGLVITTTGRGIPGGKDSKGRATPPLSVRLVRDSSFEEFEHYLDMSAKGDSCADGPPPPIPPDCTTYRVTATFTGRVDSVSKEVHRVHLRRSSQDPGDWKGFGQMGMFDAQLVVQSVENVVAVDKSEIRKAQPRPRYVLNR